MQFLKKVISLLLVVAMLSSVALVAAAEDSASKVGAFLDVCDADGNPLTGESKIQQGDTIKVKLRTDMAWSVSMVKFYIAYDPEVLTYNEDQSALVASVADKFTSKDLVPFVQNEDEPGLEKGKTAVCAIWIESLKNNSFEADTVWAEMSFTAKATAEATELRLIVVEAERLHDTDMDFDGIEGELTPHNASVTIAAAPVAVESVTLNKTNLSLAYGATEQLTATVLPENADDKTVTWESEDAAIASVVDGLVTGLKEGTTTITATAGGKTATCTVNVAAEGEVPITGISISGLAVRPVTLGGTITLAAKVAPTDATHAKEVSWESSNSEVATVTAGSNPIAGVVSGKSIGTAVITASAGGYSASVTVNVSILATKITITSDVTQMPVPAGTQIHLNATMAPENAMDVIEWKSSASAIASVSESGLVTALSEGTATITAQGTSQKGTYTVKVVELGEGNYAVSMPADKTVTVDEEVSLPITISSDQEEVTAYNAFKLQMSYDSDALDLLTTESELGENVTLSAENGEVEILRHGEAKELGTMLTLRFKVKAVTDAEKNPTTVSLLSAQVDTSSGAVQNNAPNAQITNPSTTLTISVNHFVKLPEGMTSSQGSSVEDGSDYNFSLVEAEDVYDYVVTATMGGSSVEVRKNTDGTYTIENVTGEVEITLTKTPKTYQVTLTGEDVTGANSATYGTDYVFKVDKKDGFKYEITAKISGQTYTGELTPDAEGNYRIPGTDIKGAVEIAVIKTQDTETTTFGVYVEGTGKDDVTAPERATKGTDFSFTVNMETGYMYTVNITVNGAAYSDATSADTEDGTKRTYTIKGADVIGVIIIDVAKDEAFNVTFDNADPKEIKPKGDAMVKAGTAYTFTIPSMFRVYTLNVSATENSVQKDVNVTSTVPNAASTSCSYTCTVENVQDDLVISLSWVANEDFAEVVVEPFVEWNDKTVYLIATRTKAGYNQGIKLDTYDDNCMVTTPDNSLYMNAFTNPLAGTKTFLWLTTVDKGQSFTKEDVLKKLSYTNNKASTEGTDPLKNSADVNRSGYMDINDAQLVWDIYNSKYNSFSRSNFQRSGNVYFDPQENVLTMVKLIDADVNRDMHVDALDAAAVINQIK